MAVFVRNYNFFSRFYKGSNIFAPYLCSTKNEMAQLESKPNPQFQNLKQLC